MTHKEKVLQLLSDGQWHTHHEGYALNVMLHSRVSDLRDDGYSIECDKSSRPYRYRLLDVEEGVDETGSPAAFPVRRSTVPYQPSSSASSSPVRAPDPTPGVAGGQDAQGAAPDTSGQMTLTGGSFTKQRRAA